MKTPRKGDRVWVAYAGDRHTSYEGEATYERLCNASDEMDDKDDPCCVVRVPGYGGFCYFPIRCLSRYER